MRQAESPDTDINAPAKFNPPRSISKRSLVSAASSPKYQAPLN